MVIGYTLSVEDSKSRMFSDDSCLPKCLKCGYRLDFFAHNASYRLRPNQYDLCATYDGQLIGSLAFKRFCERERYEGVRFRDFECDEVHVHVLIETVVPFDSERRQTRFENFCSACGNYESVVGATPSFLKVRSPLQDGLFRSDLLFASGNEKHPVTFAGSETKSKMESAGLRGIHFEVAKGLEQ